MIMHPEDESQELLKMAELLMERYKNATKLSDLSKDDLDHWMILQTEFWGILESGAVEFISDATKARIERFNKWATSIPDKTDDLILEDQAIQALDDLREMPEEELKDYIKALIED